MSGSSGSADQEHAETVTRQANLTPEETQVYCVHLTEESETRWEVCHYKILIKYQRCLSNSQKEHQRDTITIYSAAAEHQGAAQCEIREQHRREMCSPPIQARAQQNLGRFHIPAESACLEPEPPPWKPPAGK